VRTLLTAPLLLAIACSDVENPGDDVDGHDHGLVTTLELSFAPDAGGEALVFSWSDPENDGDPVVDPIVLPEGEYALSIALWNELEDPADDVTAEVEAEGEEHQLFLTGSGVQSEATGDNPAALLDVAYGDEDAGGLPLGLEHSVATLATGDRELLVTLRHLPAEDGSPTKTAGLAADVATDGFGAIPGDTDVQVRFDLTVE
jgi:hypothetical protein